MEAPTDTPVTLRKRLLQELQARAFVQAPSRRIVGPEGEAQKWLFDFKRMMLEGRTLELTSALLWETLSPRYPFQLGGLETAAIALVAGVVMKSAQVNRKISGFYVRKSRKKDGLQNMIEGTVTDEPIILVDDGINSGRSFIRQIELLERLGKQVVAVCAILRFREESYYRYFREKGIEVISLFTLDDFPLTGGLAQYARDLAVQGMPHVQIPFKALWAFASPDPSYFHVLPKSAPAIDDSRVYFGADNGTLWALNQPDGSVAWSHKTLFGAGEKRIFSSPTVHDGVVYFGGYDGNFYALDAATGKKRWIYFEADWIGSSPTVAPDLGLVYVGLEFGLWKKEGGIAALDVKTGKKKWSAQFETFAHSSPGYSKRHGIVVIGSTSGTVYGFDAQNGTLRWEYKTGDPVRAGFALDEERGFVCFGSEDRSLYVLDTKNGALVHKIETMEPVYSTPLVANGVLYAGCLDKRVLAIDLKSGDLRWSFWTHSRIFASPIIVDGHVFIGSNDGRLYEIDAQTGAEIGFFQATERIVNRIAYNPKTKRFFVPTYANEMYCLEKIVKAPADQPSATA